MTKIHSAYPLILCLYFLSFLYFQNLGSIEFSEFLKSILVILITYPVTFSIGSNAEWINKDKWPLYLVLIIIFFFTFGHFYNFFNTHFLLTSEYFKSDETRALKANLQGFIRLTYFLIFIFIFFVIKKTKDVTAIHKFLSIFIITMFGLNLITNIPNLISSQTSKQLSKENTKAINLSKNNNFPDIYLVIFDGYPSQKILKKYYGFDNSSLLNYLKSEDFKFPEKSFSNYDMTFASLPAIVGMNDHSDLAHFPKTKKDHGPLKEKLHKNNILKYLKKKGYEYIHLQSFFTRLRHNPYASKNLKCSSKFQSQMLQLLSSTSALILFPANLSDKKDRIECHNKTLQNLLNLRQGPKPKFIFTHFFPPHPPYLFKEDGSTIGDKEIYSFQKYYFC